MARIPTLPSAPRSPEDATEPVVVEGLFLFSDIGFDASSDAGRATQTIRAYQLRARHRTTPQGVFAAVAELRISDRGELAVTAEHRARTYPNPTWVQTVCDQAMEHPDVLHGLLFRANNMAVRRGDRFSVKRPATDAQSRFDQVSIRATEPVDAIMDICRNDAAAWHEITTALRQHWPAIAEKTVETLLRELVRNNFILTDLAPDDVCNAPLDHVLTKIPTARPLNDDLSRLRELLIEADRYTPGAPVRMAALTTARCLVDEVATVWRPIGVDCVNATTIRIPDTLAAKAVEAANVLWRLSPRHDPFAAWHDRFIHRYGTKRLVPLLEACDPVTGLGCTLDPVDQDANPRRSMVLAELLSHALTTGDLEVEVTTNQMDALDQRHPDDRAESSVELYARVIAASVHDRDTGRYRLVVTNLAAPAGSTRARFAGLLHPPDVPSDPGAGAMAAELAFQPLSHAVASLTGRFDGAPWRIPIGINPRPGDLLPIELGFVSDGHRLRLWSTRHDRPVQPIHRNQVGHHLMPDLAAFLCVLGKSDTIPLTPWNWGPFDCAPFLPRVRYGDTILAPARWQLPDELIRATKNREAWDSSLSAWRVDARPVLPAIVAVDDADRQLPLDLDRPDDPELLRRYIARGAVSVVEQPGGPDAVRAVAPGPGGHHELEVVIPLAARPEPDQAPNCAAIRRPGEGQYLPGGEWLSIAITAPSTTHDAILNRLARFIHSTEQVWDRWFWLRYHTDALGPHLRVRFHGETHALSSRLLPALNQLCGRLIGERLSSGFTVEPYDQEIERYGGPAAIIAVENVFWHDSKFVLHILNADPGPDARVAATAASAAAITRIVADTDLAAMEPYRLTGTDRRTFNRIRPLARELSTGQLDASDDWQARDKALRAWRDLLPTNRTIDAASSVIHMHANRMLGDTRTERIARALAKDLLRRNA